MLIGYARVSTGDQTLDLQLDALNSIKCDRIFKDVASGAVTERPGLDRALDHVRSGDTLVVWRLDRLGRSLAHLISVVTALSRRGCRCLYCRYRSSPAPWSYMPPSPCGLGTRR